jgi:hypothetical protein
VPDDYLEDIMSLTLADFEYLESKLPRGIFKDITKYLKSPRAIKECERLHDEFLTRFCTSYDKI